MLTVRDEDEARSELEICTVQILYSDDALFCWPVTGWASVVLTEIYVPPLEEVLNRSYSRYTRDGWMSLRT